MAALLRIVVLLACLAGVASGLWFLVIAFTESVAWGIGCLLLPFPVGLFFTVRDWDKVKVPTLISLSACLVQILATQGMAA